MSEFMDLNKKIHSILGTPEIEVRDLRQRCPKCDFVAVEVFNLLKPYVGPTGIFHCMNPNCNVDTFDPHFPEALPQ